MKNMISQAISGIPRVLPAIGIAFLTAGSVHAQTGDPVFLQILNNENTLIELDLSQPVSIDPASGNVIVTPQDPLACTATSIADCDDVRVDNVTLSASPSNISQGQDLRLTWGSRGAWDCEGTVVNNTTGALITSTVWDDVASRPPSGGEDVPTSTLDPDTYEAAIECRNGPVAASATAPFTVTDPNPDAPAFCIDQGRVPPPGMTQDTAIIFNSGTITTEWSGTWGLQFPEGNQRKVAVEPDRYVAIAFDTGSTPVGTGIQVSFSDPQFSGTVAPGDKMITISECPGDFGPQDQPGCRATVGGGTYSFAVENDDPFFCDVQRDTVYYLNILYTDETVTSNPNSSPTNWFCTGANNPETTTCGNIITP